MRFTVSENFIQKVYSLESFFFGIAIPIYSKFLQTNYIINQTYVVRNEYQKELISCTIQDLSI